MTLSMLRDLPQLVLPFTLRWAMWTGHPASRPMTMDSSMDSMSIPPWFLMWVAYRPPCFATTLLSSTISRVSA